jgi:cytochrome P450
MERYNIIVSTFELTLIIVGINAYLNRQAESQCIYFPFSHGPRKCLGQQFSFLELKLITAMLVSRYTLRRPSEKNIKAPVPDMAITLYCQNGLWMKLRPVDETPNAG